MLLGAVGSCKATSRFEMNCLIEAFAKAGRSAEVGAKTLQFTDVFQFEFALQNMGYSFDIHGHSIYHSAESTFNPDKHLKVPFHFNLF